MVHFWLDFCKCQLVLSFIPNSFCHYCHYISSWNLVPRGDSNVERLFKMGLFNMLCTLVMAGSTSFLMSVWLCGLQLSWLSIARICISFRLSESLLSGNQESAEHKGVSNKHQLQQKGFLSFQPIFGLHRKAKGMQNNWRAVLCKQIAVDVCSTAGLTATLTCSDAIKF